MSLVLDKTLNDKWVKIYRILSGASVAIVQGSEVGHHQAKENNAVMLSLVTENVDGWHGRINEIGNVKVIKPIYDHDGVPIRAILVADPDGYAVGVFQ